MSEKIQSSYEKIHELFVQNPKKEWEIIEVAHIINIDRTSIHRHLKRLILEGKIQKKDYGKYIFKVNPLEYIRVPFFSREKKKYNPTFLAYAQNVLVSFPCFPQPNELK